MISNVTVSYLFAVFMLIPYTIERVILGYKVSKYIRVVVPRAGRENANLEMLREVVEELWE